MSIIGAVGALEAADAIAASPFVGVGPGGVPSTAPAMARLVPGGDSEGACGGACGRACAEAGAESGLSSARMADCATAETSARGAMVDSEADWPATADVFMPAPQAEARRAKMMQEPMERYRKVMSPPLAQSRRLR
ncbi:MAG: hypothetical protein QM784_37990 [Polyangiaceae bacterium]